MPRHTKTCGHVTGSPLCSVLPCGTRRGDEEGLSAHGFGDTDRPAARAAPARQSRTEGAGENRSGRTGTRRRGREVRRGPGRLRSRFDGARTVDTERTQAPGTLAAVAR